MQLIDYTILITRASGQADDFAHQLALQGARTLELPALFIGPPPDWQALDRQIAEIDTFDWLIFTSANAIDFFMQRLAIKAQPLNLLSRINIAVVGAKTAARLKPYGLSADFIPPESISDSLVASFPGRERLSGIRMLYPCLQDGHREWIIEAFSRLGADIQYAAAYSTGCPEIVSPNVIDVLRQPVDVVTFASPKTARCFLRILKIAEQSLGKSPAHWLETLAIASIGPLTSKACHELFGRVDIQANDYSVRGMVEALVCWAKPP